MNFVSLRIIFFFYSMSLFHSSMAHAANPANPANSTSTPNSNTPNNANPPITPSSVNTANTVNSTSSKSSTKSTQSPPTTKAPFSDLYFLATENQVKLLDQKLEYRIPDKNSIQIGNLIISNNNFRLSLDEKNNLIAEGPMQLMFGGTLILKDPLGKSLWSKTIDSFSQFLNYDPKQSPLERKKLETGKYLIDSINKAKGYLDSNSIFTFCVYNETKTNRIQICTPVYTIETNQDIWLLKNPTNQTKKENIVIVNGVEVNEHGIIQFDKEVQSVALAINLATGLYIEIKAFPIELEFLDIDFDESKEEVELKLREKYSEKKTNFPWLTKVSLTSPSLYIEAFGQIPLRQELRINRDLLPKAKDKPTLEKTKSKTYSSSVALKFKSQSNLKLKAATKGDSTQLVGKSIIWKINNINVNEIKPHLIKIESNEMKLVGAYEVNRSPSWLIYLESGLGQDQSKTETSNLNLTESKSESQKNSILGLNINKYFDSFIGYDNSLMNLRWGLHLITHQYDNTKVNSKYTDVDLGFSYRLNENFHHSESSSSFKLSALSRAQTTTDNTATSSQWLGLHWLQDGPVNFQNFLLRSLFGDFYDFQLSYFGICLNKECKDTTLLKAHWQTFYIFKEDFLWLWNFSVENAKTKTNTLTQINNRFEFALGLGMQF